MSSKNKPRSGITAAQRGYALAFTLVILVCVSLMISVLFQYAGSGLRLSTSEKLNAQTYLLAQSGLSYALALINNKKKNPRGVNFQTDKLTYWPEPPQYGFTLSVNPHGLYSLIHSTGLYIRGSDTATQALLGIAGQRLDLSTYPALALMNKQGNLVLAGRAEIRGDVMLWRGSVRKAASRKVRFQTKNSRGHVGKILDSTSGQWKNLLPLDIGKADKWMKQQDELLEGANSQTSGPVDSSANSIFRQAEIVLRNGLYHHKTFIARDSLIADDNIVLHDCRLTAGKVIIRNNSALHNCLVYAGKTMNITGAPRLSGQFMAGDTLILNIESKIRNFPLFYVHGGLKKDSVYAGLLRVKRGGGQAVLVFGGAQRRNLPPATQGRSDVNLEISSGCDFSGLVHANGLVNMQGSLNGSLICENLRFKKDGTIYLGHLLNARIHFVGSGDGASQFTSIPAPLMFPLSNPAVVISKVIPGIN